MNKNQKILAIIIVAILAIIVLFPSNVNQLFTQFVEPSTDTTLWGPSGESAYTGGWVGDSFGHWSGGTQGKLMIQGQPSKTMFDQTRYVTAWYSNTKQSEKITLTGYINWWQMWESGERGHVPMSLLGYYYWIVDYYDVNGVSRQIVNANSYDSNYIQMVQPSSWMGQFSNLQYQGIGTIASGQPQPDSTPADQWGHTDWWAVPWSTYDTNGRGYQLYNSPSGISTPTYVFYLKGPLSGYLKATLVVSYCDMNSWGGFFDYHYKYYPLSRYIESDKAILESGDGQVDVTSQNSLSGVPGYTSEGTIEPYTRYVYQEGQTVNFQVKLGAAGVISPQVADNDQTKQWKLDIFSESTGISVSGFPIYFTTEETTKTVSWKIPDIVQSGDNVFKVRLTNGLMSQAEMKLFVVRDLKLIPGKTTVTTDNTVYTVGQTVTVTLRANPNPTSNLPISYYDAWAKYYSTTSSSYAFSNSRLTSNIFSFTPVQTGYIYIMAHAIDTGGNVGAESDVKTIQINAAPPPPTYTVTITVSSDAGSKISDADVIFGDQTGKTDGYGIITISDLQAGIYTLKITKAGYYDDEESIEVSGDITKDVTLIKSSIVTYSITVTVKTAGETASPLANAIVDVDGKTQKTNSYGIATIDNLELGSKSVKVTKTGYTTYTTTIELNNDEQLTVFMKTQSTPGFEMIIFIIALGVMIGLIRYKRGKKWKDKP